MKNEDRADKMARIAESLQYDTVATFAKNGDDPEVLNGALCCLMIRLIHATTESKLDAVTLAKKNAKFILENINEL
jgi:hypothetical protein